MRPKLRVVLTSGTAGCLDLTACQDSYRPESIGNLQSQLYISSLASGTIADNLNGGKAYDYLEAIGSGGARRLPIARGGLATPRQLHSRSLAHRTFCLA